MKLAAGFDHISTVPVFWGTRGGHMSFKPSEWVRYALQKDNFHQTCSDRCDAYHGTMSKSIISILFRGLRRLGEEGVVVAHPLSFEQVLTHNESLPEVREALCRSGRDFRLSHAQRKRGRLQEHKKEGWLQRQGGNRRFRLLLFLLCCCRCCYREPEVQEQALHFDSGSRSSKVVLSFWCGRDPQKGGLVRSTPI